MKKKFLALALTAVMALSLAACCGATRFLRNLDRIFEKK